MERREIKARELAKKGGIAFETLDEVMQNAYLHNADEAIIDEDRVDEKVVAAGPVVCRVCGGAEWIGGKACHECNPVGLNPPEVEQDPTPVVEPSKVNLCDYCQREYPACDSQDVEYGDGLGNDNIIKCGIYLAKGQPEGQAEGGGDGEGDPPPPPAPDPDTNPGEETYQCNQCSKKAGKPKYHKSASKIGRDHKGA